MDAIGASHVDGTTEDVLGLIVCQRNDEEVWSGANQTHGYTTTVVARPLGKGSIRAQRDRHDHEHGRHGHDILERHNGENPVGID